MHIPVSCKHKFSQHVYILYNKSNIHTSLLIELSDVCSISVGLSYSWCTLDFMDKDLVFVTYRHNRTHRLSPVWLRSYNCTLKPSFLRLGLRLRETFSSQTRTSCKLTTSEICLFMSKNFINKESSIHLMHMIIGVGILWRISSSEWEVTSIINIQNINLFIIILSCINKTVRSRYQTISGSNTYIHHGHNMSTSTMSSSHMNMASSYHQGLESYD